MQARQDGLEDPICSDLAGLQGNDLPLLQANLLSLAWHPGTWQNANDLCLGSLLVLESLCC